MFSSWVYNGIGGPASAAGQTCRLLSWEWSSLLYGHLPHQHSHWKEKLGLYGLGPAREQVQREQFVKKKLFGIIVLCYTSVDSLVSELSACCPMGRYCEAPVIYILWLVSDWFMYMCSFGGQTMWWSFNVISSLQWFWRVGLPTVWIGSSELGRQAGDSRWHTRIWGSVVL